MIRARAHELQPERNIHRLVEVDHLQWREPLVVIERNHYVELATQRSLNLRLASRNEALRAEVLDLRAGKQALEERARYDLGMVKPGEIFVQVNEVVSQRPAADEQVRTAAVDGVGRR